jgi:hypothetical protein
VRAGAARVLAGLALAAALAGCAGLRLPGARRAGGTAAPRPRLSRGTAAASGVTLAEQTIRAFATVYINWNAGTVSRQMAELAAASTGQARSEMALAAQQTRSDGALRAGGIANRGTVEAVAPLAGRTDQYVVVTQESTSASATDAYQGLQPAWHLTLATVGRLGGGHGGPGWVISGWQPEN